MACSLSMAGTGCGTATVLAKGPRPARMPLPARLPATRSPVASRARVVAGVFTGERGGESAETSTSGDIYRKNVGICMVNHKGEVFAARRMDDPEATWQMPQGGIDDGEHHMDAAFRELHEETSVIDSVQAVHEHSQWLRYHYPTQVRCKHTGEWKHFAGQEQKWVLMHYKGDGNDIDIQNCLEPEFSEWAWVPLSHLPEQVVDFKRPVYEQVVHEFGPILEQIRKA